VLAVRGQIYPSTEANVRLEATLADGKKVSGETRISRSKRPIQQVELSPRRARPLKETLDAIAQADLITLGPGSLYTSVIPHLLVEGIPQAIAASPAIKAYFTNLMTQPGETTDMEGASDHLAALLRHGTRHGGRGSRLIDVCVVNTGPILRKALEKYRAQEARPVTNDVKKIEAMGVKVVEADLVRIAGRRIQEKIRHDPGAISAVAIDLARKGRRAKERLAS